jgi:hypothetical protein
LFEGQKKWPSETCRRAIDWGRYLSLWRAIGRSRNSPLLWIFHSRWEGTAVMISSHTRLLLRAERRKGVWRLSGFDAIYLRDEIAPVIPGQAIAIDPEAVKPFRPTYRLLSYCLASGGFPVPNDLAGIDRPDLVDALLLEIYGWAGLTPPR